MTDNENHWILPNRAMFPEWALEKYKVRFPEEEGGEGYKLFRHQRIVREFMRPESPFRGLLLYHGLGVGKTCAAIAVAELLHDDVRGSSSSRKRLSNSPFRARC